jgi:hypothetical protein
MPLETVTVHSELAVSVAVAAESVKVAVVVPELDAAAVKVVVPHPLDVLTPAGEEIVKVGSTNAMLSLLVCTSGVFSLNV